MKKKFIPIFLLGFVNTLGFSILFPVLPFIVAKYGGGAVMYGLLLSSYSISQFFATPFIGSLSDRFGRRPTLILSQLGTLLSWGIFAIAYFLPNNLFFGISIPFLIILLSRAVDGITGGNISVANAYIADVTKPEERTKIYGLMGAVTGMAFMLGPVLGGISASFSIGYLGMIILASLVSLITLIFILTSLPESLAKKDRDHHLEIKILNEINIFKKIAKFKPNKVTMELFLRRAFFAFAFASFTSLFALYAKDILLLDERKTGFLFLFIGVFLIFNQAIIVNKVAKRIGEWKTFHLGQWILILFFPLLIFRPSLVPFLIVIYITNLGIALIFPTFRSLLSQSVDKKQQGQVSGVDEAILAGMNGIAPLIATALYGIISVGAFGIISVAMIIPYLKKRKNKI